MNNIEAIEIRIGNKNYLLKDDILIENNNKFLSKQDIVIENITDAAMFIVIFILLGKEFFIYSFIEYIFKKLKNIFTN